MLKLGIIEGAFKRFFSYFNLALWNLVMNGNTQREQILKRLERHYISPLSQFWIETELLKKSMLGRPSRIQIAVPDSWRENRYLTKNQQLSVEDASSRLEIFERYLDSDNASVFAYDKPLILGDSFPYFEWVVDDKIYGLNHLLGRAHLFYLYKGSEEAASLFYELIEEKGLMPYVHVIGELPEALLKTTKTKGIAYIDDLSRPFLEHIAKGRGLANLFNQSADVLLMDRFGHYEKSYSRAEFVKQLETLSDAYFS